MITRPDCDARTAVPFGTAMSTPACRRPQRWPKGDTTGPFAGQIRPPDPRLIGALALPPPPPPEAPAAEACADRGLLALERLQVALQVGALLACAGQQRAPLAARIGQRSLALDQAGTRLRHLVLLGEDRVGRRLLLLLELGQLVGQLLRLLLE